VRRTREVPWGSVAIAAGSVAVGFYLLNGFWSATRVDVDASGITHRATLTSQALADRTVKLVIEPASRSARAVLRLDGRSLDDGAVLQDSGTLTWQPGRLPEGDHLLTLSVPRPVPAEAAFRWRFTVDDTPPALEAPSPVAPVGMCEPVSIAGRVEKGASLTVDGRPVKHRGDFNIGYAQPPVAPLHLVATDAAGNSTSAEVVVPARYPGGQGIHVTAAAWGYEPLRRQVLALVDAGLVSVVELDLKDEDGVIGYDSKVPLATQVGAVRPEYRLDETVADLKRRGVRVIGRVVAFRDPRVANWAWANDRRDWVVQTARGAMFPGGFTNHAHPEVRRYNVDIAVEAATAGVDDIMWDYVRRPEGDPAEMVIPGLRTISADSIVEFLAASRVALREHCAFQGAAVFGIAADRPHTIGQDVPRMARHVDYLAPMLYPSHWVPGEYGVQNPVLQPFDITAAALADFQAKVAGTGTVLIPWLQDFSLGTAYGRREVRAQIDAAASLGVSDWLLWNAEVRYTQDVFEASLVRPRP